MSKVTGAMTFKVCKYGFILLLLGYLIFLLGKIGEGWKNHKSSKDFASLLTSHGRNGPSSPPTEQPVPTEEEAEERNLLESIAWPQPPPGYELLDLSRTSDPARSRFTIVPAENGQRRYVGDQLEVRIRLRDFEGRAKSYGGDLLFARLRSARCEAGVAGQVLDHGNGLYSARFPLLWEGAAQVDVTMVHSSEAVAVLRRLREKRPDRVYYFSVFRRGRRQEKTVCNLWLPQDRGPLCNYTDPRTGEPWYCYKPETLGCDSRYDHAVGGYAKDLVSKQEALLFQGGKNIKVPIHASTSNNINVLPSRKVNASQETHPVRLATSGYYYQDVWRPTGGMSMRHFDAASAVAGCLTNKLVYMYGDSTMRQWFEYLLGVLPGLKKVRLENPKKSGPFMAVDSSHNILLEYRFHGTPIRIEPVPISELRYVANELDGLTGGPNTVVALAVWAHFGTYPVEVYIKRLRNIRRSVVRLLNRAPGTLVVVRTANPQALERDWSLYNSDWLTLQQDMVLRAMFKDVDVVLVDAWQMCLAHHEPHNLHPSRAIVKTMVDMMLSYVCPDGVGIQGRP